MALYMRDAPYSRIMFEKLAKTRRRGFIFGFATIFLMLVLVLGATSLGLGSKPFVSSKTPVIPANILAGTNSLAGSPTFSIPGSDNLTMSVTPGINSTYSIALVAVTSFGLSASYIDMRNTTLTVPQGTGVYVDGNNLTASLSSAGINPSILSVSAGSRPTLNLTVLIPSGATAAGDYYFLLNLSSYSNGRLTYTQQLHVGLDIAS